jgi:hypothetical protein
LKGERFSSVLFQSNFNDQVIWQKVITMIRNGYSVTFVLTYKNDEGLKSLEKIINSITLKLNDFC